MPIYDYEINSALALYDNAMNGDIEAGLEFLDLYNKALAGDPTAEGLLWAICYDTDRRVLLKENKDKINRKKKSPQKSK